MSDEEELQEILAKGRDVIVEAPKPLEVPDYMIYYDGSELVVRNEKTHVIEKGFTLDAFLIEGREPRYKVDESGKLTPR